MIRLGSGLVVRPARLNAQPTIHDLGGTAAVHPVGL